MLESFKPVDADRFTHVFCGKCGSSLPFLNLAGQVAVIPMGSLDDVPDFEPQADIYVGSKARWATISDG